MLDEDDENELLTGHLIIYDAEVERKWVSQGGAAARNTLGLGEMSIQEPDNVNITGGRIVGIELDSLIGELGVEYGGTGASDPEEARTNLDAQKHSDWLDDIASFDLNDPENENYNQIIMSKKGGLHEWSMVAAETARDSLGLKIGATDDPGDVQAYSDALQNFSDASETNVAEYDLLIYKTNEDDGSWELLKGDDEEYHITASRVEHGDFFISEAGITGDIWMSDGSEAGAWWKAGMYLTIGNDTLDVNVGTAANQVIALNAEAQLPAVDASLLLGLTAEQINVVGGEPSVTNEEFNALGDLRLESTDATEAEDNWRLTYGIVQDQLDDKQNGNANLDDLADGELTYDKVEFGEFFIKQAGDDDKVWTWVGTEADGAGSWIMPPGAQRLNDLMDASTMPLAGDDESSDNVFIGEGSGNTIDGGGGNGNLNTALGRNTLASLEDGNLNVAIGKDAGQNIVDGSGNILIGFNAGKDLGINASNKLIINNNNSADLVTNPLIEGDFVAGEVLINNSLYSTNSLHLGSSTDPKFTIVQNEGDIAIKSEEEGKKISFAVNGDDELLIMETVDGEEVIQLIGTTKIVSDETNATYINIDESGANLNLTGQEDVVVNAAQDVVVNATEDVVVNATEEFTLNGNNISLTGAEIITIKNESGQDNKISFVVNDEDELLKMESDGIIKLVGTTKIAADDDTDSYINASEDGTRLNVKGADKVLVHALNSPCLLYTSPSPRDRG